MNCGGAPMSSCRPLKIVTTSSPSNSAPAASASCRSGWRPSTPRSRSAASPDGRNVLMHQAIPERSIICPISSSSGTKVASWSRDRLGVPTCHRGSSGVHLHRVVDVGLLVVGCACRGRLALGGDAPDDTVEARTEREADVMGEEDRHLLQLVLGELLVLQGGVDLHLAQILQPQRGHHRRASSIACRASTARAASRWCRRGGRRSGRSTRHPRCSASPTRRPRSFSRGPYGATRPWSLLRG